MLKSYKHINTGTLHLSMVDSHTWNVHIINPYETALWGQPCGLVEDLVLNVVSATVAEEELLHSINLLQ